MTRELQIMNEVLEAIRDDNFNNDQMNRLLIIISQQLSEKAPNKALKQELDNQVEYLLKEIKWTKKANKNNAGEIKWKI